MITRRYLKSGVVLLIMAEFCFAAATVFAKYVTNTSEIRAIEITFFRVALGTVVAAFYMWHTRTSFRPNNVKLVIARAVFSFSALVAFFYSVEHSSVTNGNMLNMTYPVFIFLLAPLFGLEKMKKISLLFLAMAMVGIYLVIFPDFSYINKGDLIGLVSGILAAFAIISLSVAREFDSTVLIVFYLMAIGTVCNAIMMIPVFIMPSLNQLPALLGSGAMGLLGQILLTMGYKNVTAKAGSMVSSSRIIFAALMGFFVFSEPMLPRIVIGGLMIIFSIIGVSLLTRKVPAEDEQ
ncbi:MAG TPA: DMT family transporter [Bacteroidales bacterium]|jgi:drug/metabolite transporter (DMT)-like permease|nr:DMT family transporter [Bacteroidales bacterium]